MNARIIEATSQEYHASKASPTNLEGAISKSLLFDFVKSPFKWRASHVKPQNDAMKLGSLIHTLCFTPAEFTEHYAVSPFDSFRTKESREWRDNQEQDGKTVITQAIHDQAVSVAECITDTDILYHLGERDYEVAIEADFQGTPVRGMIDIAPVNGNILADLKTTSNIDSLEAIQRNVVNRGYHWQAAMYLDLWNAATGQERDEFHFLFIEVDYPCEYAWVRLDSELIDLGRIDYMNALLKWKRSIEWNQFPKAIEGLQTVTKPAWLKTNQ